ncbi:hypothetical protein L2E82_48487 [Cichorium intybus]|uniref:Uncharacterized protein n=1 Tax=Cichorium intybus TaxID=13427 RepID=A0ACB8YZD1_CICIN|nr:hypothetical protein L2E82_48487 [Cichorium intybus]
MGVLPKTRPFQHRVKPCCRKFRSRVRNSNRSCFLSILGGNYRQRDSHKDAAGLGAFAVVLIERFSDLLKILLRRAKLAGAEVSAKNNDGENQAEKRDLAVTDNPLELTRPASLEDPI